MGYQIKSVAELLGIPRNTLLAWERRYSVVKPARLANGYRVYSEADVTRLRALKRLLDDGHRVSEALTLLEENRESSQDEHPVERTRTQVLKALLRLDRDEATQIIQRNVSLSYARQLDTLYFPLLKEVGRRWSAGNLSVAQEHFISHFCREQLTAMLLSLAHGPQDGPKALCAVYPDDPHDLPLLGVSVKLALSGHRILFLGARTPIDSLLDMIQEHQPDIVCISIVLPVTPSEVTLFARSLLAVSDGKIMFGGAGLPENSLPTMERVSWVYN